jgi:hypothetical protein
MIPRVPRDPTNMAGPNPSKEMERLQRLCKQGLPTVVVLSGAAQWFRDQALAAVLDSVAVDAELRTVDGLQVDVRGLASETDGGAEEDAEERAADGGEEQASSGRYCPDLDVLRGGGLFAAAGVLVVRRGSRWLRRYQESLLNFLPHIGKGCVLVLEVEKLDKRTRLSKELAKVGELFEFRSLYEAPFGRPDRPLDGELVQWVVSTARSLGVPLTQEAALVICAQVSKEPGVIHAELCQLRDRLAARAEGLPSQPLVPQDLAGLLTVAFSSTPFEFAEAVLGRNRRKAWRSLRAIFDRGVKRKDGGSSMDRAGLLPFVVSWTFTQFMQVLEGRTALESGTRLSDVAGKVGVRGFTERFEGHVRDNDRDSLERGILALMAVQRELRLHGEDDDVLIERFLDRWFDGAAVPTAMETEW